MEERTEQVAAIGDWLRQGSPLLVVVGEAGVGKTTLLQATLPATAVRCCARYADSVVPLGVVRALVAATGSPEPRALRALLARTPGPDNQARLADAVHGLAQLLAGRLVVVDDAHWADPVSLRLLGGALCVARGSALVVGTRPWSIEHHPGIAELVSTVASTTVTVPVLSQAGVRAMLERARPERPPTAADVVEIHHRTGGLPLLVESMITADGTELDAHVARTLASLGPVAARVLRAVAVLGGTGSVADVATVCGVSKESVLSILDVAAAAGLLAGGQVVRIRHPLVEELIVASGGPSAARSIYARAAQNAHRTGSEPDRIAALLMRSWPIGESWAVAALLDAARSARRVGDPRLAQAWVERAAAEEAGSSEERAELRTIEAWCALQLDDGPSGVGRAEEIIDAQEQSEVLEWADRTRAELVEFAMLSGDIDLACVHARALLASSGDDPVRRTRGLRAFLGATYLVPGTEQERLSAVTDAQEILTSGRSDVAPVLAHAAVTFATAGQDRDASRTLDRLSGVRFDRHPQTLVDLGLTGVALIQLERLGEAQAVFAEIDRAAGRHRIDDIAANARTWCARLAAWRGDSATAREAAAESVRGRVWPVLRPVAAAAMIGGVLLDGTDAELASALAAGYAQLDDLAVAQGPGVADLLLACAKAEQALGSPSRAGELVGRAVEAYPTADWLAPWPLVALQVGCDVATEVAREAVDRWIQLSRPITGSLVAAWPEVWSGMESRAPGATVPGPLHCELLILQGRTARRAGRRVQARTALHEALNIALQDGYRRLARTARDELHLAGGRARGVVRPFGLTPAEQRVAVLAAQGRSNREISAVLVISVKTVESHMAKVLAKSGRQRGGLSGVAAEISRLSELGKADGA